MNQKNKFSTKKSWYDKELKTRQGEVIIRRGDGSFKIIEQSHLAEKFWIDEEIRLFFKENSYISNRDIEVFVSFLYNMLGIETMKVRPALSVNVDMQNSVFNETLWENGKQHIVEGMLAEDFLTNRKNQKELRGIDIFPEKFYKHSVEEHLAFLQDHNEFKKIFKQVKSLEINPNIESKLRKLILLDFLTLQGDRGKQNLSYILTEREGYHTLDLAPIYDNSMAFLYGSVNLNHLLELHKQGNLFEIQGFIKRHYPYFFNFKINTYPAFKENDKDYIEYHPYKGQAKDISDVIIKDKEMETFYEKVKHFNLDSVLAEMKNQMPEYEIDPSLFALIKTIFDFNKNQLENTLKETKEKETLKTKERSL